jgi:hypothetical protein
MYLLRTGSCFELLILLVLYVKSSIINSIHVYSDSFPTIDEYDFTILDPDSIYGSPYGGYSRATRSRLASVPLYLPDVLSDEDDERNVNANNDVDDDDQKYMEIHDAAGRLFICRVYSEDELDPSSLGDSMYTAPKLRQLETSLATTDTTKSSADKLQKSIESGNENAIANVFSSEIDAIIDDATKAVTTVADGETNKIDVLERKRLAIQSKLNELQNICAQLHKGWWSYEICIGQCKF